MVIKSFRPKRGDVIWINGRRPALVLSPETYNVRLGLVLICPVTSKVKGYPFEVLIPQGLDVSGAVLTDQVKSMDWKARKASWICRLPQEVTEEVLQKLNTLLT